MRRSVMSKKLLTVLVLVLVILSSSSAFAQTSQTLTLKPGFNFVSFTTSISLTPASFKALNASIEDVYLFSAAAGSFLSANEGTLTSLAAGKGYIVKSSASSNISVSVSGTALSTVGNISLKSGFNLVGFSKLPATTTFNQLMTSFTFVKGLYKWSAAAGSFISVVRDNSGTPVQIDGTDPSVNAGESYFFNLTEDTLINYDGTSVLMGKTIEPPVVTTDNPFTGTYTGTFAGNYGAPQGNFTLTVSTAGALTGSGYNNSNTPATAISPSGTVTTAGAATFNVTFTNQHKFTGTFTSTGASGNFYETDGTTVKGTWSATKNAVTPQTVAAPVITPAGGTFTASQSVTITCATSGATIKYTTDGTTPSSSAGNTYSAAITVSSTSVIKAIAIKSGMTDSSVTLASFTIGAQPSGTVPFLRKFGSKGTGNGQFTSGPINAAVDPSTGYVFVSDTYGHRIQKFDASGNFVSAFGTMGTGNGQFQYPTGIAITLGGDMYVVDYGNKRVQKFSTGGTFKLAFGTAGTGNGQFQAPDCVAVEKYGSVYVTDFVNNNVQRFSSEGNFTQKWGGAGTGNGQFGTNSPKDIAIDSSDNVYVADIGNNRIQKFNVYGTYQTQWGTSGTGSGQFTSPHGVCVDSDGHIFVADKSCRIQKFSPVGDFILTWGSSGTADGQFTDPSGICADSNGNIYVADFGNSRVQVFGPGTTPTVETVATPSISPTEGTYTSAQSVTITCATSGAAIYYTTDGTTPSSSNGSLYSSAITVSATATIKAIAVKTGLTDSAVAAAIYTIGQSASKVATPVFGLAGGTYNGSQAVSITCATSGATIRYTKDGTTPSLTNGTIYNAPTTVSATTTIKVIATKTGMTDSDVATATYTILPATKVKTPDVKVTKWSTADKYWVDLVSYESGTLHYYTLDGTDPSPTNGQAYSGVMTIDVTTTVKFIGVKAGLENSDIVTKVITIGSTSPLAGFQLVGGNPLGARQQAAAVSHNGKLWVIGGRGFSGYMNDVWSSSDGTNWTEVKPSETASPTHFSKRVGHAVVSFNNQMWLIGGYSTESYTYLNDVWTSSDGANWTLTASVTQSTFSARAHHTVVVFNNKMYMMGGTDDISKFSDVMSSTDGLNWTSVVNVSGFGRRSNHSSVVFGSKIWVIGGSSDSSTLYNNDVLYSSDGATWEKATAAAAFSARLGQKSLVFENKIWVLGGSTATGYSSEVWYSVDGVTWKMPTKSPFTVFSGRAYMGVEVFNDKMWVIGGRGPGGSGPDTYLGDIYYSFY